MKFEYLLYYFINTSSWKHRGAEEAYVAVADSKGGFWLLNEALCLIECRAESEDIIQGVPYLYRE